MKERNCTITGHKIDKKHMHEDVNLSQDSGTKRVLEPPSALGFRKTTAAFGGAGAGRRGRFPPPPGGRTFAGKCKGGATGTQRGYFFLLGRMDKQRVRRCFSFGLQYIQYIYDVSVKFKPKYDISVKIKPNAILR